MINVEFSLFTDEQREKIWNLARQERLQNHELDGFENKIDETSQQHPNSDLEQTDSYIYGIQTLDDSESYKCNQSHKNETMKLIKTVFEIRKSLSDEKISKENFLPYWTSQNSKTFLGFLD